MLLLLPDVAAVSAKSVPVTCDVSVVVALAAAVDHLQFVIALLALRYGISVERGFVAAKVCRLSHHMPHMHFALATHMRQKATETCLMTTMTMIMMMPAITRICEKFPQLSKTKKKKTETETKSFGPDRKINRNRRSHLQINSQKIGKQKLAINTAEQQQCILYLIVSVSESYVSVRFIFL